MFLDEKAPSADWLSINQLLAADAAPPQAYAHVHDKRIFGDAYLLGVSPTYARVRSAAQTSGVRLEQFDAALFNAVPLCALPDILKRRAIPIVPNHDAVTEIAARIGDRATAFHLTKIGVPGNVILHEIGHVMIHDALMADVDPVGMLGGLEPADFAQRVALMFACEAVASTLEVLVAYEVLRSKFDSTSLFFLKQSTYFYLDGESFSALSAFEQAHGLRTTFQVLWLGYFGMLSRNPLPDDGSPIPQAMSKLVTTVFPDGLPQDASTILAICNKLNDNFTRNVTDFYFSFQGASADEMAGIDFPALPDLVPEQVAHLNAFMEQIGIEDRAAQVMA